MSLEYSMFRFSDDYPTAEGLSEMIMQVCMDEDRADNDSTQRLIRALVRATHELRYQEAIEAADDDDAVGIPAVLNADHLFIEKYEAISKKMGEPVCDGDAWWEDWWPTDCPWHPNDIARLARLKVGEAQSLRRQLRAEFAKHKENADAQD